MSNSFGDMGNLLKQAQEMQREIDRVQQELEEERIEGSAGAGAVRVSVSGGGMVTRVEFSDEVMATNDKSMLEDLVLSALRDALSRANRLRQERLSKITGGLNLPGLF